MYKILHLFPVQKFTRDFIELINNNFDIRYQEIWVYGRREADIALRLLPYKNVKYFKFIKTALKSEEIYQFDKIFNHSVFHQDITDFFYENKKLLKRLYLYFWGGDKFEVCDKRENHRKKYVVRHAYGIINIIPEEKKYMQKVYRPKGKFYCVQYDCKYELHERIKNMPQEEKNYIAIQLGNSATQTNNHIYVLHLLSKFKNENIRIFAPLSYGDLDYAKIVIEEGKRIFGEKFTALKEFMNEDEYYQFLNSMDIAIFDMKRQQALGNIYASLYFGKKVFLRNNSVLSHFISVVKHCDISTTDEIGKMNFQEFISFPEACKKNNEQRLAEICAEEPLVKGWREIFNEKIKV